MGRNCVFSPSIAGTGGPYTITYTYTSPQGCSKSSSQTTIVRALPLVNFVGLSNSYCVNAAPALLTGNMAPQGTFSGPGITNLGNGTAMFDPAVAGVGGPYQIIYTYSDNWDVKIQKQNRLLFMLSL